MGLFSRIAMIFNSKANKMLDNAEDPRETLDYSYEKQLQLLQSVKRGIVEVVTAKRRLDLQAEKLQQNISKREGQARDAVAAGREDLARLALQRKQAAQEQLYGLGAQIDQLAKEQDKLTQAEQRLTAKVESFRTRKEVIKAQYSASEAQVRIGEAVTGLSEEFADVGMAIERAEQKTETLQAKAAAIDELVALGTLDDYTHGKDDLDRELAKLSAGSSVEQELQALKAQVQPKQIGPEKRGADDRPGGDKPKQLGEGR